MITFSCSNCGKNFSVKDELAGRKGKCKSCHADIVVPDVSNNTSEKIIIELDTVATDELPQEAAKPAATHSSAPEEKIVIRFDNTEQSHQPDPPANTAPLPQSAPAAQGTPSPASTTTSAPATSRTQGRRLSPRLRRLQADADQVSKAFVDHPPIRILARHGDPPDRYEIEYNVKGLERRGFENDPIIRTQHIVEIQLTREYPRSEPLCKMRTPVFHPNINPSKICIGDHWSAGRTLVDIIIRIGQMLSYQHHYSPSPLDMEADQWARNQNQEERFPIDNVNCVPKHYDF